MTSMPRLLDQGRWRQLTLITLALIGQAAFGAVAALATRDLFAALASAPSLAANPVPLALLGASGAGIAACRYAARLLGERLGQDYAHAVRRALFSHTARMPRQRVATRRAGAMSLRFVGDLTALRSWASLGLPRLISAAVVLPTMLAVLFVIEPAFGWLATPIFVLALIAIALMGLPLPTLNRELRRARGRMAADLSERMPNAPFLHASGRTGRELALIDRRTATLRSSSMARVKLAETLRAVPEVLSSLAGAGVIGIGLFMALPTASVAGGLAALGLAVAPLTDLSLVWNSYSAWRAAREKCQNALSHPLADDRTGAPASLENGPPSIFDPDSGLSLAPGEKLGLIAGPGPETSLLLIKLAGQEPGSGVLWNDTQVEDVPLTDRCLRAALITPEDPLLKGSLRRALTLSLPKKPSDKRILAAVQKMGLAETVNRLGGLDATIAEGGRDLSPAERTACLGVRVLLTDKDIILIDGLADLLPPGPRDRLLSHLKRQPGTVLLATRSKRTAKRLSPSEEKEASDQMRPYDRAE